MCLPWFFLTKAEQEDEYPVNERALVKLGLSCVTGAARQYINYSITRKVIVLDFSAMSDFEILMTVACQVPLSLEFSQKEYWSG